jgi:hypothetical protein
MDPQHHESAGMQLPPPVEQAPGMPAEQQPGNAPEQGNAAVAEQSGASAPAQRPAAIPLPTPPQMATAPQAGAQPVQNAPTAGLQASDDSDLIEKEWVNKAKQIVEKTRDDPHKQSEELTLVKVDYMKKRYNKTLKLK